MSDRSRRRLPRAVWIVTLLILVWIVAGIRAVDEDEFGVLSSPLLGGFARPVDPGPVLAPPGLLRLTVFPSGGVELPLPGAAQADLPASNGSRFGLSGWATLRARREDWRALYRGSAGAGLSGALLQAVRETAAKLRPGSELGPLTPSVMRDLEQGLLAALDARGVELRRLEVRSFDFLAALEESTGTAPETRLLVIGLDGADWAILDDLIDQGRMPNFERLVRHGARAKLLSISPLLSPVIWTTVATGVEPSRHGILDFLVEDAAGGNRQPVTSAQRRVPTAWELLSRSGVDVGVIGWWASWPADPVRGYQVSDRIAYQLFGFRADADNARGKTWPPDLYPEIRPLIHEPDSVTWEEVAPFLSGERDRADEFDEGERELLDEFRTLLASGRTYLDIAGALRERLRPRLEVLYLEGTDTVGHLFMPYRLPALEGVDPERVASFSAVVDRYYEKVDTFLGTLLEDREGWTVMIVSDHGFATDATRPRTTDSRIGHGAAADWHRRFGILVLSGEHVVPEARLEEASVYDVAPTILALFGQPVPRSWPGKVLAAAIAPEFLARHPVRYSARDPERRPAADRARLDDPAAADLMEKLESLGYVGGVESDGGGSITARNNAGVALLAEGKYADAEREFRAGLEEHPEAPMLLVNLALARRFQGDNESAERLFEQALAWPSTLRLAGQMLAQIHLDRGDLDTSEVYVQQVLEAEPDAAELRNTYGLILERRGDLDGARREFERAAELDPDAAMPRNNLGNLAKRAGDLSHAEQWYQRAIEADPYFMGAYNNLALVYQSQQRMQDAIDLYDRALGKSLENPVVLNNLGSLYYATGDQEQARRLFVRAAAADPEYVSPLNNIAGIEINAARFGEAERLLSRALELEPDYGDARINLSIVFLSTGRVDEARAELQRATTDPRTGANSWRQLGLFELGQGRASEAAMALERALDLSPGSVQVLNALGEAYYRAGETDRAREIWTRSLELQPDQPRLRQALAGE